MPTTPILPPPQYDYKPQIPVIEQVLKYDDLQVICGMKSLTPLLPGQFYSGCSAVWLVKDGVKTCFVWRRPNDNYTRRHELAHCNGWPVNHPGGYVNGEQQHDVAKR
jgi:hypothetical protein